MRWNIPPSNPMPKPTRYPWLVVSLIFIALVIIFFVATLLNWPTGKLVDNSFIHRAFLLPASVGFLIAGIVLFVKVSENFAWHTRNYLYGYLKQQWKYWGRSHLLLHEHASLSSLSDLALKILRLEGEFPTAPATPLEIDNDSDEQFESTRLQRVLTSILKPLEKTLSFQGSDLSLWLYVHGGSEDNVDELKTVLKELSIPAIEKHKSHWLAECPDLALLNTWIDTPFSERRLLIIVDLHTEDKTSFCENAQAFLFTHPDAHNKGFYSVQKPSETPLYWFRTLESSAYKLAEDSRTYLAVEHIADGTGQHLWHSGLDKQEKYGLYAALDGIENSASGQNRHDVNFSLGDHSDGQIWLTSALAADAARYGQGSQLVSGTKADNFQLGLISIRPPKKTFTPENHSPILDSVLCSSVAYLPLMGLIFEVGYIANNNNASIDSIYIWLIIGGFISFFVMGIVTRFIIERGIEEEIVMYL